MSAIRELTQEAHEIVCHINEATRDMELTAQQRNELISLVMTDVREKISLAAEMSYYWTGIDASGDKPTAA